MQDTEIGAATSLYLLCCILRIVKIKDLANTIAAALLCRIETFRPRSEAKINGYVASDGLAKECEESDNGDLKMKPDAGLLRVSVPNLSCSQSQSGCMLQQDCSGSHFALRCLVPSGILQCYLFNF